MYEPKKQHKGKDEMRYDIPEWIRILKQYFREDYDSSSHCETGIEKKKKKGVEDLV